MATVKTYVTKDIGTSLVACNSTGPAANTQEIAGIWTLANTDANYPITIDVCLRRSAVDYYLLKNYPLNIGDTLYVIGLLGKLVTESGDVLYAKSSRAASMDSVLSVAVEP